MNLVLFFVCLFFKTPHVSEIIQCFSLTDNTVQAHLCCHKGRCFSFCGWVISQGVCRKHLLYPLTCWWTLRLCPCLGCCTWCCRDHGVQICFRVSVFVVLKVELLGNLVAQVAGPWGRGTLICCKRESSFVLARWFPLPIQGSWAWRTLFFLDVMVLCIGSACRFCHLPATWR